MKQLFQITAFLFSVLFLCSCDTVLGPPGSEPPMPPSGSAVPYDIFVEGEPSSNIISIKGGFFVWRDSSNSNNWHVRVARLNVPQVLYPRDVYVGDMAVENGFVVTNQRSARLPDEIRVGLSEISFRFEVEKDIKGLDFSVKPASGFAYCVNIDYKINGSARPEVTYLGRSMYSPVPLPLKICVRQ